MSDDAADFKKIADASIDEFRNIAHIPPMTLRDYFAAAAMQGMLAEDAENYKWHSLAAASYECADWMLRERAK